MVFPKDVGVKQCKEMELLNKSQLLAIYYHHFSITLDLGKLQDLIKTF